MVLPLDGNEVCYINCVSLGVGLPPGLPSDARLRQATDVVGSSLVMWWRSLDPMSCLVHLWGGRLGGVT